MNNRLTQAASRAKEAGLDALVLVPGPNLTYLTGLSFITSERPVVAIVPATRTPVVVLPQLEAAKAQAVGFDVFAYTDEEGYDSAFRAACETLGFDGARLGAEALHMRLLEATILHRFAPQAVLLPADAMLSELRMVKSAEELDAMRRAVRVAEAAFLAWVQLLRPGMTEKEAASRLVASLLNGGADALAFDPIVASGPRGALPHAVPGARQLREGDWVVVDWGAKVDGYCSDLTRAVVIGEPGGKLREVHEIVVSANRAGRDAIAPGVDAQSVDRAARAVIEDAGYGAQFFHRLGHGLGLEEHEPPYIVAGNALALKAGMAFTVEPGIYLEGIGGVRIEDDVAVTSTGSETLSTLARAPFRVPL
ncbi:MAG: M24 family metallopeptidase [Anaerolineae bacterium]